MTTRKHRPGFTLVELLVVIAIIGMLIALLLPAVQAAREAGRRGQCINKMKQLALGVHNYESSHGHFPPAGKGYGWCGSTSGGTGDTTIYNMSGWVLVLPYIEQMPLYQQLDQNQSFSAQATGYCCGYTGNQNGSLSGNPASNINGQLMSTILDTFICPSDPGQRVQTASSAYGPGGSRTGQKTNYDFIASRSDSGLAGNGCNYWSRVTIRYPFGENSDTTFAKITDGSSNTFMVGESTVEVANGQPNCWGYRGWVMTGVDPNGGLNIWDIPTSTNLPDYGNLNSWGQAGSLHPDGAQFAFCDASARFVSQKVASSVLLQVSRMDDGYVPALD